MTLIYCINIKSPSSLNDLEKYFLIFDKNVLSLFACPRIYSDKVRPHTLRSGCLSFEEGSHLPYVLKKEKKRKVDRCHKLLLVLGGILALTRSHSEIWQVARIWLCGRGAVCGALKMSNCPFIAARTGNR